MAMAVAQSCTAIRFGGSRRYANALLGRRAFAARQRHQRATHGRDQDFHAILLGKNPEGTAPRITHDLLADKRAWDALPILTPRFMPLFGRGTKWPVGWGPAPSELSEKLDASWKLLPEYRSLEARTGAPVAAEV